MMSGALAGIFGAAPGLDLYYPPLAFLLGMGGAACAVYGARFLERKMRIDDAVGAVSVHGIAGLFGVLAFGIFASGYPNVSDYPDTSFLGQFVGAVAMALVGFVPGYVVSLLFSKLGILRIPEKAELVGMDRAKVPVAAYPEDIDGAPAAV